MGVSKILNIDFAFHFVSGILIDVKNSKLCENRLFDGTLSKDWLPIADCLLSHQCLLEQILFVDSKSFIDFN